MINQLCLALDKCSSFDSKINYRYVPMHAYMGCSMTIFSEVFSEIFFDT